MSTDVIIRAEGLGKKYVISHHAEPERYLALRDVVTRGVHRAWRKTADMIHGKIAAGGATSEDFWALKDINFEVKRGDVLGIIGRNGAGKSTLLKILSRITEPSEGRVTIKGRVASLLEVGTGFHPELTGRENIYLNGAILGMSRAEIRKKFDEIVDFAEVERFLDTPVKRFSSGMYVRLAFAVAAHLEPEIIVIDEVLAVGDVEFQKKCLGKMSEVASGGRTVLFVSHNTAATRELCNTGILIHQGRTAANSDMASVLDAYSRLNRISSGSEALFKGARVDLALSEKEIFRGQGLRMKLNVLVYDTFDLKELAIVVTNIKGVRVGVIDLRPVIKGKPVPKFSVEVMLDTTPLVEDTYSFGIYAEISGVKHDHERALLCSVHEPAREDALLPFPQHVRGFVELKTSQRMLVDEQLPA